MATYKKADAEVADMATKLLLEFETHKPLVDCEVKIDFIFAYPRYDANGEPVGDAIRHRSCKALGLCRKISLKDRAMGRGDAEILLDAEWWKDATESEQRALLDHELNHIAVKTNSKGEYLTDDLGRPQIGMRPHDFEFGWFSVIAERHGENAQERIQAKKMMDAAGQYFWPWAVELTEAEKDRQSDPIAISVLPSEKTSIVTIDAKGAKLLRRAAAALRGKK